MTIRLFAVGVLAAFLTGIVSAQTICSPQLRWQHTFGTEGTDEARGVIQAADGGFWVAGDSAPFSGATGNRTSPNYGGYDFVLVRLDATGQKLWDKAYGGNRHDGLYALEQTSDGGLILGGHSDSGTNGNKTSANYGQADFWVVRTDSEGNPIWDRTFGGARGDGLVAIKQTADGGFIAGGSSDSLAGGNKTSPRHGQYDYWVVRLDPNGNKLWEGTFGGDRNDFLTDVEPTPDGGFVAGGWSESGTNGNRMAVGYGQADYWIVRLDGHGNRLWDRAFGGDSSDILRALVVAPNGDLLLAGHSSSQVSGKRTAPNVGYQDWWVLRLDAEGAEIWQGAYGGNGFNELFHAVNVPGGFALAGTSGSLPSGTKTSPLLGQIDYWAVKINGGGSQLWDGSFGGTYSETAHAVQPTADGGFVLAGGTYSVNGHKAAPHFGSSDFWVVKLGPENANDCDNDGVVNAQDECGGTPAGAVVNANGCAIAQLCPCSDWLRHADYVACVGQAAADFEGVGLISASERAAIIAQAETANCPVGFVAFGLEHVLVKDTTLGSTEGVEFRPGTNPVYGVSVLLGEADSGVFIDPDAGGWGWADPAWFVEGRAYNGTNGLIATVRATKPGIETYPVTIDLSPLGATNVTLQFFSGGALQSEETSSDATGTFTVHTAAHLHPRVNPFWRMADGSVGALIEFNPDQYEDRTESGSSFDQIFVRANAPTRQVDYVSRVDVTGGGGLEWFSFVDEGLGMFRNRHRILGSLARFQAANRQLAVRSEESGAFGTRIEMEYAPRAEVDFQPIDLNGVDTSLRFIGNEFGAGLLEIAGVSNGLTVLADFRAVWQLGESNLPTAGTLEVSVFRNGALAGRCTGENATVLGRLTRTGEQSPRIIGCIATSSNVAFSVDYLATFVCTNGSEFSGTHFRIAPLNPTNTEPYIRTLEVILSGPLAFTITDERSSAAQPRLSITSTPTHVTLAWPDHTRRFQLESSPSLLEGFTAVPDHAQFVDGRNVVVLPRETTGSRFFRLRDSAE